MPSVQDTFRHLSDNFDLSPLMHREKHVLDNTTIGGDELWQTEMRFWSVYLCSKGLLCFYLAILEREGADPPSAF